MPDVLVTDTHALLWHMAGSPRKLGRRARRVFDQADAGKTLVTVPVVVLVEVLDAFGKGRLRLDGGFGGWVGRLRSHPGFTVADLTADIVLRSAELLSVPDRTDRLIAATALHLGARLITRDAALEAAGIATVW